MRRVVGFCWLVMILVVAGCAGSLGSGSDSDSDSEAASDATATEEPTEVAIVAAAPSVDDPTPAPTPTPTLGPIATPTVTVVLADTAFTNQSKVSTAGIDEVIFGTEATAAAEAASTIWVGLPQGVWPECFVVVPANGPEGVEFWVWSKLIERVDITTPALRTRSGYGVGTQLDQLRQELGDLITVQDQPDGTQTATFTPSDTSDQYRLIFEVSGGEVTSYRSGRAGIIEQAPGSCGTAPSPDQVAADSAGFTPCEELGLRTVDTALPNLVRLTAEQVQAAAGECDLDALEQLASAEFTASFGGGTLRSVYGRDGAALTQLTQMLSLPAHTDEFGYAWPRAFGVSSWSQVTEDMLNELRFLGYDDDDFAVFADFGGYVGYRARITAEGEWTVFVAGD